MLIQSTQGDFGAWLSASLPESQLAVACDKRNDGFDRVVVFQEVGMSLFLELIRELHTLGQLDDGNAQPQRSFAELDAIELLSY